MLHICHCQVAPDQALLANAAVMYLGTGNRPPKPVESWKPLPSEQFQSINTHSLTIPVVLRYPILHLKADMSTDVKYLLPAGFGNSLCLSASEYFTVAPQVMLTEAGAN